jgi:hypothetical protein
MRVPDGNGICKADSDIQRARKYLAAVEGVAHRARLHPNPDEMRVGFRLLAFDLPRACNDLWRKPADLRGRQ